MVYVHVATRARFRHLEATPEELKTLARLSEKGLKGEDLEAALAGEGIAPERAKLLAGYARMRRSGNVPLAVVTALVTFGVAVALGTSRVSLKDWLHHNLPGWEWLPQLIVPLVFLAIVLVRFSARSRRAEETAPGATRADRIDNRPIE